jgi:hypothetical protein
MSTPPTGEDPQRGPSERWPTTPQPPGGPAYGQPGYGQQPPPWGQPSFGPPPGGQQAPYGPYGQPVPPAWQPGAPPPGKPPRDSKRTALIVALVVVGLALVAGVALLVYVLSSTRLDRASVERDVAAQFEERNGVELDLDCRHRMIVRPGADYECEGTTADGEEIEIRIMIENENGAYTWAED